MLIDKRRSEMPEVNPYSVMCVVRRKDTGEEVGRIAAASQGAANYIDSLVSRYGAVNVAMEENETEAMVDQMVRSGKR